MPSATSLPPAHPGTFEPTTTIGRPSRDHDQRLDPPHNSEPSRDDAGDTRRRHATERGHTHRGRLARRSTTRRRDRRPTRGAAGDDGLRWPPGPRPHRTGEPRGGRHRPPDARNERPGAGRGDRQAASRPARHPDDGLRQRGHRHPPSAPARRTTSPRGPWRTTWPTPSTRCSP